MSSQDNTTMAAIVHVLGLVTWIVGPAIVYFVTEDSFTKENAANALNWQIILTLYLFVAGLSVFVLIGFVLTPLVMLVSLVFCILAAIKASDGEAWSYPATIDIV